MSKPILDIAVNVSKIGFELCKSLNNSEYFFKLDYTPAKNVEKVNFTEIENNAIIEKIKNLESIKSGLTLNVSNNNNNDKINWWFLFAYTLLVILATWKLADWYRTREVKKILDNVEILFNNVKNLQINVTNTQKNMRDWIDALNNCLSSFNAYNYKDIMNKMIINCETFSEETRKIRTQLINKIGVERDININDVKKSLKRKRELFFKFGNFKEWKIVFLPTIYLIVQYCLNETFSDDTYTGLYNDWLTIDNIRNVEKKIININGILNEGDHVSFQYIDSLIINSEGRFSTNITERHMESRNLLFV